MRYSLDNLTETAEISVANVADVLGPLSSFYDRRTTRAYVASQDGSSAVTITLDLGGESDIDLVALVGLTGIAVQITVTLKYLTSTVASETVSVIQPVQQSYAIARFDTVGADEVEISFNVGDGNQFGIGYLFAGTLSDEITIAHEAINYGVESTDPRNITRAGGSLRSAGYLVATAAITAVELPFSEFRSHVKLWAEEGYATPRLWYFEEPCILTGEAIYGILDADRLQLDPRYREGEEARSPVTLGLVEVF